MSLFVMEEEESPSERLLNAASFGRVSDVISAIKAGGDVNYVRLDISPALICAIRSYGDCLEVLMAAGARTDIPNRSGWTALHEASIQEDPTILKTILSFPEQCNAKVQDQKGYSALMACMNHNRFENADLLIAHNRELLSVTENDGANFALSAVRAKKIEWLQWAIKNGVSPYESNSAGQSASSESVDWEEGAALIKEKGFEIKNRTVSVARPSEQSPQEPQDQAPANPFGLGGVKKKKFG